MLPYFGGEVVGEMSVGSFNAVFQEQKIIDEVVLSELKALLKGIA